MIGYKFAIESNSTFFIALLKKILPAVCAMIAVSNTIGVFIVVPTRCNSSVECCSSKYPLSLYRWLKLQIHLRIVAVRASAHFYFRNRLDENKFQSHPF